jgi:hypothetical protein
MAPRKLRTERVLIKRRTTAALEDFRRIEVHEADPAWYGYWFHRRLLARRLKPLVQVSYARTARLGSSPHGKVRMTLDLDLRVLPPPDGAFLPGVGLPLMEESNIIEVKYCVTLPPIFHDVISQFSLKTQPVSKIAPAWRCLACRRTRRGCRSAQEPLSIVPQYVGRLHPEYPQKRPDTGESTHPHHGRPVHEQQRGMSRHGADSHVIAQAHRDQGPHDHAAHGDAHCDLKKGPAEDGHDHV